MNNIKFIGKSNKTFTNGNIYQLFFIEFDTYHSIEAYISNNNKKIEYVSYIDLGTFNENWEVVDE